MQKLISALDKKLSKRAVSVFEMLVKNMNKKTYTVILKVRTDIDGLKQRKAYDEVIAGIDELASYQIMVRDRSGLDVEVYNIFIANFLTNAVTKTVNVMLNDSLIDLAKKDEADFEILEVGKNYRHVADWE